MAKLKEDEIARKCRRYIQDAREHTIARDQRERAELYQDFCRGGKHQWTQEEYDIYKSRGVEPVTINRCKPALKGLLGMYLQSRQEVRVRPRRNGSATVAQVWTEVLKHTQDVSYADYVYAQVFMRGGIDTESYLKLEIDPMLNVNGQPVVKGLSIWDVDVDRNATEYDLNESAEYVIERQWKAQDEINAMYPDQEEQIRQAVSVSDEFEGRFVDRIATWMSQDGDIGGQDTEFEDNQVPDIDLLKKYRYLVQRVFWKETVPAMIVGDRQTRDMQVVTDEKLIAKLRRKAGKSERFGIVLHPQKVLHESVMLGETMLEDKPEPLGQGVNEYPIVRFSPMWDLGYASGALDDITSLNKEENIHRTQTVRILNQTANSGWIVGDDSDRNVVNTVLKKYGSVPGVVIPLNKLGGKADKITPNQLPVGHFEMGRQFELDIKRVSGIDDATQGYSTGQQESGRAINLKQQNNRSSAECFFDNFYRSLEILGNLMLKVNIVNRHYSDEEIRQIVDESSMIDPTMMAKARAKYTSMIGADLPQPQPLPPLNPQMMMGVNPQDRPRVLQQIQQGVQGAMQYAKQFPQLSANWDEVIKEEAKNMLLTELRADRGMYGVKVTVSPSSPTERITQFLQMDALMTKYGNLIPPDVFIDLTDLPNKEEIKQRLMQAQQAQAAPQMRPQPRPQAVRGAA